MAAYLDWLLAVVEAPNRVVPTRSSRKLPVAVAVIASAAPTAPTR